MRWLFELPDRVVSAEVTPDGPGHLRRRLVFKVESGSPLTEDEARRVLDSVVAELAARGVEVVGWGWDEEE